MQRSGGAPIREVTRFEIQAGLFHELQSCGLSVRGGIRIEAGRGFHTVDIAVMELDVIAHALMVSTSEESVHAKHKNIRDHKCTLRGEKLASLGCPVTVIRTLKDASDLMAHVRRTGTLPTPAIAGTPRRPLPTEPATENQKTMLVQLCAARKRPVPEGMEYITRRQARGMIRAMQNVPDRKPR